MGMNATLSPELFEYLTLPGTREIIDRHIGEDPVKLALTLGLGPDKTAAVCTQIKYLQRCRAKLPAWYEARCGMTPLSSEQATGENAAAMKRYSGWLCLDLTCGLGVDTFRFSRTFERVVAVERDPVLAEVARYNFRQLGARNIEVITGLAEDFIRSYSGPAADLVYVDPARREDGKKSVLMEDCSPDVSRLYGRMLEIGRRVLIKLSPLFDIGEAVRIFGPVFSSAEVVSVQNECKELAVELRSEPVKPEVRVSVSGKATYVFSPEQIGTGIAGDVDGWKEARYLLVPDVGFYKVRMLPALCGRYAHEVGMSVPRGNGFCFSREVPPDFPGRVFRIVDRFAYRPKELRREWKKRNIRSANLLLRNFPFPVARIVKATGIREGGTAFLAFTEIGAERVVFLAEPKN